MRQQYSVYVIDDLERASRALGGVQRENEFAWSKNEILLFFCHCFAFPLRRMFFRKKLS